LEDALMRDLGEISAYDPKAPTRIAARILVNELDLGVINGTGRMDVEVVVTRASAQRLRKWRDRLIVPIWGQQNA
uniref:hypothetical protein n=1 Tax=Devosia sp. TaxID=1871048 RepID=UPI002FCB5837